MKGVPQGCNNNNCNNNTYAIAPLLSNVSGIAPNTYPELRNTWDLAIANNSIWVVDETTGLLTNFSLLGALITTATVVPGASVPSGTLAEPVAVVANTSPGITSGSPASPILLVIATRQGTINAYNPAVSTSTAPVIIDNSAHNYFYTDVLVANNQIYAVNATTSNVEIYNASYGLVKTFTDPSLVTLGYSPDRIFAPCNGIGSLYVAFSPITFTPYPGPLPGVGHGAIDVFSPDGSSSYRLINHGHLNNPSSMAIIPIPVSINGINQIINALAIGNYGDGKILLYDPGSGSYIGTLNDAFGNAIVLDRIVRIINLGPSIIFLNGTAKFSSNSPNYGQIGFLNTLTQVLMMDNVVTKTYYQE